MANTQLQGWKKLVSGFPWFEGAGNFPLPAYSEFMPSPRVGCSPYGETDTHLFNNNDHYGWNISEMEEEFELKPGLNLIVHQIMNHILKLGQGHSANHISGHGRQNLNNNPYWPDELAQKCSSLSHERFVCFLPLMLSKTQDYKGRVRWTFFGGSIHGPEHAFWKSFYSSPDNEKPEKESFIFFTTLFKNVFFKKVGTISELYELGFRIMPSTEEQLPVWTKLFLVDRNSSFSNVEYLLTFKPFSELPELVKHRYFSGELSLLPFPGSLVFWGMPTYNKLSSQLPLAKQIPLLKLTARHSGHKGIRIPQCSWLHEPHPDIRPNDFHEELINSNYQRTHRWEKTHRHENELASNLQVTKITKVLFSTDLNSLGLYDKPMARNCILWNRNFDLILDGPNATKKELIRAEIELLNGGIFGYRFFFPPMKVGFYDIYWHKPVVSFMSLTGETEIDTKSLSGYLTAYHREDSQMKSPEELWPRFQKRKFHTWAINNVYRKHDHYAHQTSYNIINLFDHKHVLGNKPLPREFAHHLLRFKKHESLEQWLSELNLHMTDQEVCNNLRQEIEKLIEKPDNNISLPSPLTYKYTANREFEVKWWSDINLLAHGEFINTGNADCIQDEITLMHVRHTDRDLEKLGDYLIERHKKAISDSGMEGKAIIAEQPFEWKTDFSFKEFGGWKLNQKGETYERNILLVIPGSNRKEAVVMADHYDTAYMEDIFETTRGGTGARITAAGADDNYSATSTLLNAAPIFLQMSKEGLLERDIWILHLTGEEFPSDCMGARHFCQSVIEKTLSIRNEKGEIIDLSGTTVKGVFVLDMIGHNRESDMDVFQISPGRHESSVRLAFQAHLANLIWNNHTHEWNKKAGRHGRSQRVKDGTTIPEVAAHLHLTGEVRTQFDPYSSLFNTDGQIFSDTGIPVVLFMENYDLNRSGYHDTKDTMENIDLDYGVALAAITIETVARVATLK